MSTLEKSLMSVTSVGRVISLEHIFKLYETSALLKVDVVFKIFSYIHMHSV